ncbi:Phosphoribosylformylglycinamidine cyclo-ligase [Koleobacter methoxysyntrophicus]|uniref:Phosphoribosylformylglycinamidine cyclo-ligase n=1 Tax=Koleobacter methoxysyntrophicus TaxID=2751313 RepID=A0A8A0RK49_9FIRM|nr:phosphoribosylformylglycinamidine cyclo-ligase [Koleobacter methoxysyntrophicus]QSQ08008.1 Phosphoribosylformylglycinamidine cyclo-ligase [Koleobacter methoxysyntrophicus]
MNKKPVTYRDSGVDIKAGYEAVKLMQQHVKSTFRKEVLTDIGGFGGLFSLDVERFKKPVLVSGTDGVGTKLKIAFMMDKHDTVGIDCVAMCVNDIICSGAEPLFFLDYIACGRLLPEKAALIVEGVARGCREAGCSLIGGETAEMPGFYPDGEYDIAGFAVGVVDRDRIIDGSSIRPGDIVIGLPSSGLHSNGFSMVRKIFFGMAKISTGDYIPELGCTLGEELLKPTRIYAGTVLELIENFEIKGIAHITGGGFFENLPRVLPKGRDIIVRRSSWEVPPVFHLIQKTGDVDEREMFSTFNMGIGLVLITSPYEGDKLVSLLKTKGEKACIIGEVVDGNGEVKVI